MSARVEGHRSGPRRVSRWLHEELPVSGAEATRVAGRFTQDPGDWLPGPARPCGVEQWVVRLTAGPTARSVTCSIGSVWRDGDEYWRRVSWRPSEERGDLLPVERFLPTFDGELGLRLRAGVVALVLEGRYSPPAGALGAALDAAALNRVAMATAQHFLGAVADGLRALPAEAAQS
jgi:hypothetical protein